jgi:hypothetical protein
MAEARFLLSPIVATGPAEAELPHAAYPIRQRVRSRADRLQLAFARHAAQWQNRMPGDVILEPTGEGLCVLARTEAGLEQPIAALTALHAAALDVDAPEVRIWPGRPPREPLMTLLLRVPRRVSGAVRADLLRRGAWSIRVTQGHYDTVLRCEARLATLLGYHRWLPRCAGEAAELFMRLSRYAPLAPRPGPAAA